MNGNSYSKIATSLVDCHGNTMFIFFDLLSHLNTGVSPHSFIGCRRISEMSVQKVLREMDVVLKTTVANTRTTPTSARRLISAAQSYREPPVIESTQQDVFDCIWECGLPLIVNAHVHGVWTPEVFRSRYGTQMVSVADNSGVMKGRVTFSSFLDEFVKDPATRRGSIKLKVRPVF